MFEFFTFFLNVLEGTGLLIVRILYFFFNVLEGTGLLIVRILYFFLNVLEGTGLLIVRILYFLFLKCNSGERKRRGRGRFE